MTAIGAHPTITPVEIDIAPTPAQLLDSVRIARSNGELARAAGILESLLAAQPGDADVLTEVLLFAGQAADEDIAINTIRKISEYRGSPLDAALSIAATSLFNAGRAPSAVNIGGGPHFHFPRWRNFDGVASPANPRPIDFSATTTLPLDAASVGLVYSSHCIEHLEDATVERLMHEARRIVHTTGYLVIKIPDFERAVACWNANDESFMTDANWNLQACTPYLARRGLSWDLDYRTAMLFCGFWNEEHGNHFAPGTGEHPQAYHGPPTAPNAYIQAALGRGSPHAISARLVEWVRANEATYAFNHQNAWSRDELQELLARCGFDVVSFDRDTILRRFAEIPTITDMSEISLYCVAVPK